MNGVEYADELEAFADGLARGDGTLASARDALIGVTGTAFFVEAAAVAAVFHGYVRVADGTGIPVDELVMATTQDLRQELHINAYAGRINSDESVQQRPASDFNPALD